MDRDTLTGAVSARLGITNRLEVDAKIPYVYRQDSTLNRPVGAGTADVLNEVSGNGIGDVEAGIHYQLNRGRDGWPYMIGNLRMKSVTGKGPFDVAIDTATGLQKELPTGSGFYALQPSITFLFPSDPVVFFSNMGYIYNMKRSRPRRQHQRQLRHEPVA